MILVALTLFSHPAVYTPAVRPAIAATAPRSGFGVEDYAHAPSGVPHTVTTGVKLTIGAKGRVEDCIITSTSGWRNVDSQLCNRFRRARFQPPADIGGGGIYSPPDKGDALWMPGTYDINLRWNPSRF